MQNVSAPHIVWLKALLLALIPILHFLICRYQTLPENDFHLRTQIFWSGMFGLFSLFISQAFYVFKTLRLSPRKSDPLIMAVTLVFADLLSKIFVNLITTLPSYFTWALISRSIAIAGIWYLVSHIFSFVVRAFKYQIRIGIFGTQKDIQYLAKSVRGYEAENFVHFSLVENNFCVNSYDIYAYSENSQHSDEQDYQLIQLIFHHAPLIDIRDIAEEFDSHVNLERTHISDVLTWARKLPFSVQFYIRTKLIVEPIVATSLAILLAPIMLLTALLVRISGKGPILFKQQRLGLSGREFTIYKFRTMRPDAELAGAQWAQKQDPRITRVGALLRNLHLDELPQLWNIIVGDISFVGPRPERPEFYHQLKSEIPLFYLRTIIRPGVTGWAQVFAGYGRSVEGSKVKLAYDLHYIKCMSFRMDMICLILTFVHIINKFFWGEMALHEVPTPAKAQKLIFRSTLFIFVLIAVFTLSLSAIAFAKH